MSLIKSIDEALEEYSDGSKHIIFYAFPGGYQINYYTRDGGILCAQCVEDNLELIRSAKEDNDPQWDIVAMEINYEGPSEFCDNCGKELESEYGDPWAEEE